MNKTLLPTSWLLAVCLFGFLDASHGEEAPPEPAPNSPVTFSDRFFTDTRGNYRVVGTVDWELGTLKLSPASAVARIEPLLPTFQCEIHMWPKGSTIGKDVNVSRLTVPTSAGYELVIAIFRQEQQGRLLVQVILGEIEHKDQSGKEAPQVTELRRMPPKTDLVKIVVCTIPFWKRSSRHVLGKEMTPKRAKNSYGWLIAGVTTANRCSARIRSDCSLIAYSWIEIC